MVVLLCLPLGCAAPNRDAPLLPPQSKPSNDQCLNVDEILPDGWEFAGSYRRDTNHRGKQEWIILYRFDLSKREASDSPIGAVIYQLDDATLPSITAHDLHPPDGDYLCECECTFNMENVLSGLEGDELIVRDQCGEHISRLTIFQWDPHNSSYTSPGHFVGDDIRVDQDVITVATRLSDRAQLSRIETYYPDKNKSYYQPNDKCRLLECRKQKLVFCNGEPADPTRSPYPEKTVLAFYNHFTDETAPTYFTDDGWKKVKQCDAKLCGCESARSEITHVRVIDLKPETQFFSLDKDANPTGAKITVTVVCENRDGQSSKERSMQWRVIREADQWLMDGPA